MSMIPEDVSLDKPSNKMLRQILGGQRYRNANTAWAEKEGGRWDVRGSGLKEYSKFFDELWPLALPDGALVLDIMGNAQFVRDLQGMGQNVHGIGIELADSRTSEDRIVDVKYGNLIVEGDILNKETWIKMALGCAGVRPSFIVCRGEGAIEDFPRVPFILHTLLNRAYWLLDSAEGILLTQVPTHQRQLMEKWSNVARDYGIDVVTHPDSLRPRLKIIRHAGSPQELPPLV